MPTATHGKSVPDPSGRLTPVLIELMPLVAAWAAIFAGGFALPIFRNEPTTPAYAAELGVHLANRQIVAVLASAVVAVFAHEGAHLLAAVALRDPIRAVVVGVGPRVWRRGRLTVRLIPVAGHVRFAASRGYPVVTVAGPAINAILAVAIWCVTSGGAPAEFRWALVGPQLWYVLLTGVPARPLIKGAEVNDATALLRWYRARNGRRGRRAPVPGLCETDWVAEDASPEESETWTIRVAAPVADVWNAVVTPGVGADPAAGVTDVLVPGTDGPGIGDVWLSIAPFSNGRVLAVGLQVVEWEPGHRMMLRGATMESLQVRVLYHLTPNGAGTHLKLQHTLETMSGQAPTNLARRFWLSDNMPYLTRLREHCEAAIGRRPGPKFSLKGRPADGRTST